MTKIKAHFFELVRFGLVGGLATLVHLGAALLLNHATNLPLIVINIAAFCMAFGVSFFGHYHFTFQSKSTKSESFMRFFIIAAAGLAASTALLSLLVHFDISSDTIKLTVSIFVIPAVTYILSKKWAFREKERAE